MEGDFAETHNLPCNLDDSEDPFIGNEIRSEFNGDVQRRERVWRSSLSSLLNFIKRSFELSVVCGILFGLFTTFLWWIELNANPHCFGKWDDIPIPMRRLRLIADAIKVFIIMFWPLLTITPICSWSMIKESNLLFWCTIAGFLDIIDRFCLFTFEHYDQLWNSLVGNVIFTLMSFTVFYKFAKYRQKQSINNASTIIVTLKLGVQLIFGLIIFLPYNYIFLKFYYDSPTLIRTILSCSLIALFYVPKLIIGTFVTNLQGIYKPDEGIIFGVGFLIIATMVMRLSQARVEKLTYFTMISLVHGIFNVIDKLILPIREKMCSFICRRKNNDRDRSLSLNQQYIAHQSLVSVITETTSVIMSNAAAYLLVYYYRKEESTGKRYEGSILFKDMVLRSSVAVGIEWFFNIIALKIQNDWYKIPVLCVWKRQWKFLMIVHLIQVIYVVAYFAHYVNVMLLEDVISNSTQICVGLFKRV